MRLTLFDLDGTLLPGDSDHAFGEFLLRLGWADAATYRQCNDEFFAQYQAGKLNIAAYVEFATQPWRDREPADIDAAYAQFMAEFARPAVRAEALELVSTHRQAGDLIAIVTATQEFITRPIAELFEVHHLIATELLCDAEGRPTGAIRGTPAFREGKIVRVRQWLNTLGHAWGDFDRVTFYSDSTNDLPLLEAVSHPVATNPSAALADIANARQWPILQLFT